MHFDANYQNICNFEFFPNRKEEPYLPKNKTEK